MQLLQIIGTLGADAEVKDLGSNQVIEFSVAVSESWTDKQGQKQSKTTWFSCAKWGNQTTIAQYIKKGDKIFISGKPNNRAYLKNDGTAEFVNGITVENIELLGSKKDNQQPNNSFADTPKAETNTNPQEFGNPVPGENNGLAF